MTDIIKQCDVVDSCEDCPRYGDDCDGEVVARGKWISLGHQIGFLKHPWSEDYRCSLCGYEAYTIGTPPPKVCPQCHANNIIDKANDVIEERNEVIE